MRIVGYARVSTREQGDNTHALEQQIARLKQVGANEILSDVESGRKDCRPQFEHLMDLVRSGAVQQVIITRLDRLTRSLPTLRKTLDEFQKSQVNLLALDDSIDMATAAGKFHLNMLGALAEMESDRLSERIRHGKEHFRSCKRASHPPFGYIVREARYELDIEPFLCQLQDKKEYSRSGMARDLIQSYLEQKSLNATCRYFTERWGYQEFWPSALRNWLTSPTLQGHLCYYPKSKNPIIHTNTHDRIITAEQAREIEEIIAFNRRVGSFGVTKGKYALTGLVVCGECGGGCVIANGSKGKLKYFLCAKSRYQACPQISGVRMEVLEAAVIDAITQRAEQLTNYASSSTSPDTCTSEQGDRNALPSVNHQDPKIQELQQQLQQLEIISGNNPAIAQAKSDIARQIQHLSRTATVKQIHNEQDREFLKQIFSDTDFWQSLTTEDKQRVFRRLVQAVEMKDRCCVGVRLRV